MGGTAAAAGALQVSAAAAAAAGGSLAAEPLLQGAEPQPLAAARSAAAVELQPLDAGPLLAAAVSLLDAWDDADEQTQLHLQQLLPRSTTFLHSSSFFIPFHFLYCTPLWCLQPQNDKECRIILQTL